MDGLMDRWTDGRMDGHISTIERFFFDPVSDVFDMVLWDSSIKNNNNV